MWRKESPPRNDGTTGGKTNSLEIMTDSVQVTIRETEIRRAEVFPKALCLGFRRMATVAT